MARSRRHPECRLRGGPAAQASSTPKARADTGEGRIDVFGMLVDRDIPVMFRPLKNLLGAFIDDPRQGRHRDHAAAAPGAAVHGRARTRPCRARPRDQPGRRGDSRRRSLFVAGTRATTRGRSRPTPSRPQLLTPQWLIVQHMKRQGWRRDLDRPGHRLPARAPDGVELLGDLLRTRREQAASTRRRARQLLKVKPKAIKQRLAKPYEPENWYGDVWLITERDNGMVLEGSRSDLVVLKFLEHGGSGYVWQFGDLADAGLAIVEDGRAAEPDEQHIGGVVFRTVIAESAEVARAGTSACARCGPGSRQGSPCTRWNSTSTFPARCRPGSYRHSGRPYWVSHEFDHRPPRPSRPVWTGP